MTDAAGRPLSSSSCGLCQQITTTTEATSRTEVTINRITFPLKPQTKAPTWRNCTRRSRFSASSPASGTAVARGGEPHPRAPRGDPLPTRHPPRGGYRAVAVARSVEAVRDLGSHLATAALRARRRRRYRLAKSPRAGRYAARRPRVPLALQQARFLYAEALQPRNPLDSGGSERRDTQRPKQPRGHGASILRCGLCLREYPDQHLGSREHGVVPDRNLPDLTRPSRVLSLRLGRGREVLGTRRGSRASRAT